MAKKNQPTETNKQKQIGHIRAMAFSIDQPINFEHADVTLQNINLLVGKTELVKPS